MRPKPDMICPKIVATREKMDYITNNYDHSNMKDLMIQSYSVRDTIKVSSYKKFHQRSRLRRRYYRMPCKN